MTDEHPAAKTPAHSMLAMKAKVHDPTQQEEGAAAQWVNEPLSERHVDLLVHTDRPFNAEPPNYALQKMITPEGLHYRRQHTPVPVVDEDLYCLAVGLEGCKPRNFSMSELKGFRKHQLTVTFMCTGNRRSEFNAEQETMGLPWKNGSISTASWGGTLLLNVLKSTGIEESIEESGYRFLTFYGLEDYHISIPLDKAFAKDGDCILAWEMNGKTLPRDHGFPLRVVIPGFVGARSVKWISRILVTKNEVDGMHQVGIAYKQLGPNIKKLSEVSTEYIHALPPIDHVPVTSAITAPESGAKFARGEVLTVTGYAYSGAGKAVIRVDVSIDGGKTWGQAAMTRASETQGVRSGRAWAWVQWTYLTKIPENMVCPGKFDIVCKAIDDQYNQQPHDGSAIWNLRGILNTSWGRSTIHVSEPGLDISAEALSGDGTIANVGIKLSGSFPCLECRQRFDSEKARELHWKFIHDPSRHNED